MTYGTPQNSPQSTCLPIGVGLSYDELTLLSCDVHRNSQNVRLFDIQSGQLKHTITGNQVNKYIHKYTLDKQLKQFLISLTNDSDPTEQVEYVDDKFLEYSVFH